MGDDLCDDFDFGAARRDDDNVDAGHEGGRGSSSRKGSKKRRKSEDDDDHDDHDHGAHDESTAELGMPGGEEKKKKKKKRKKKQNQPDGSAGEELGASSDAIAASFMKLLRQRLAGTSVPAELDRMPLLASDVISLPAPASPSPSSSEAAARTARDKQLGDFLANFFKGSAASSSAAQRGNKKQDKWRKKEDKKSAAAQQQQQQHDMRLGRPRCVVVCMSALRCCAVAPVLRQRGAPSPAARLFAKHMKVAEQAALLRETPFPLAVGTPNRLAKLLLPDESGGSSSGGGGGGGDDDDDDDDDGTAKEQPPLSLADCELLVLDATFKDAKNFTLLSLKTVSDDLAALFKAAVLPEIERRRRRLGAAAAAPPHPDPTSNPTAAAPSPLLRVVFA
jgi:hypothetical protein